MTGCPECARLQCEKCFVADKTCHCGEPATRLIHLDKYIAFPHCDNDNCVPYRTIGGNIFWVAKE